MDTQDSCTAVETRMLAKKETPNLNKDDCSALFDRGSAPDVVHFFLRGHATKLDELCATLQQSADFTLRNRLFWSLLIEKENESDQENRQALDLPGSPGFPVLEFSTEALMMSPDFVERMKKQAPDLWKKTKNKKTLTAIAQVVYELDDQSDAKTLEGASKTSALLEALKEKEKRWDLGLKSMRTLCRRSSTPLRAMKGAHQSGAEAGMDALKEDGDVTTFRLESLPKMLEAVTFSDDEEEDKERSMDMDEFLGNLLAENDVYRMEEWFLEQMGDAEKLLDTSRAQAALEAVRASVEKNSPNDLAIRFDEKMDDWTLRAKKFKVPSDRPFLSRLGINEGDTKKAFESRKDILQTVDGLTELLPKIRKSREKVQEAAEHLAAFHLRKDPCKDEDGKERENCRGGNDGNTFRGILTVLSVLRMRIEILNHVTERLGGSIMEEDTGASWKEWAGPLQEIIEEFKEKVSAYNFELVSATASLGEGVELFENDVDECLAALQKVRDLFKEPQGEVSDYEMIRRLNTNDEGAKMKLAVATDTVVEKLDRIIANDETPDTRRKQADPIPMYVWMRALNRMRRAAKEISAYASQWFPRLTSLHQKPPGVTKKEDAFREALQEIQKDLAVVFPQ
uniref:Uncharacterized protein n=1 Tax=Chromera velia CCMP2878 TaxID=1169474 RepID=A0A0G4FMX8_9ALVE|eukprot:Cvel_17661.t1-p1 / transcript=Cvel_17661.t1 / gene=Cvel_17661 / organism=Chromera_velia_CCMP2878 / gene_product=hypothetical protein / transcript_product=hypothetical protein / location=Cvel_scaffold1422:34453-38944(-) / protein_length=624 / sequence_SO=supercontig / SO=protein_coding / is_pseudo=false